MDNRIAQSNIRSTTRLAAVLTFSALTVAACGLSSSTGADPSLSDGRPLSETPQEVFFSEVDADQDVQNLLPTTSTTTPTTAPTPVIVEQTPTTAAPATTAAPLLGTTVSPKVDVVPLTPAEVDGSYLDDLVGEQTVQTADDDALNVRSGPGVSHRVLTQLAHETGGISHSHSVELETGPIWNYVYEDGEPLGWVNSSFLIPTVYLENRARTANCTAGADFPDVGLPIWGTGADVDFDGLSDDIVVYAHASPEGSVPWVSVHFASGGVATGHWDGLFDAFPVGAVHATDLTRLDAPIESAEIVLHLYQGASHGTWGVLGLNGCTVETTRHADGTPFTFAHGASAGHSTVAGCAGGSHGEVEFVVTNQNFNSGEWTQTTHELDGLTWNRYGSPITEEDFPNIEPSALTLDSCGITL